ncbi:MAG TPA: DUF624 domain-containing protein [Oscillospiraceae bacterium]|nr:DUF624 domain-containing protein [Oscillospiraceae bacterium]
MAGFSIFGGNYSRPGPGVRKDEPQKPPFIRFWQLFFRKFSKLVQLNLLFFIPTIVVCALMFGIGLLGITQRNLSVLVNSPLSYLPVILISPFVAGLTMITRNFAREEHAFIWSDYKDAIKKNWKPFLINGFICYIFVSIMYVALRYYLAMSSQGWMYVIALSISILVAIMFLFAQYYIPVMIITLDLNLKQIYRNAFIFAVLGLWRNLMLTIIFAVLFFANFVAFFTQIPLLILIAGTLILLIAFSFMSYLINFAAYPLIEKMIIKPYYEKLNAPAVESDDQAKLEKSVETKEDQDENSSSTEPEYVFIDGKLVKKYSDTDDEKVFKDKI